MFLYNNNNFFISIVRRFQATIKKSIIDKFEKIIERTLPTRLKI